LIPFTAFILGTCVGSFLNVCLFRWKKGLSPVAPPSACPSCGHLIRWFDNIPIVSFLVLGGECRDCGSPISIQYPLLEAVTGFLFWASARASSDPLQVVSSFVFVSFLVLLTASDLKWRLLPHVFNNLFLLCAFVFAVCFRQWPLNPFRAAEAVLVWGAILVALAAALEKFLPQGLGGGDIKMITALAAWMGVLKTSWVVVLAFGLGALVAVRLVFAGQAKRKTPIPFGPFLALASAAVWFYPGILRWVQVDHGTIF
jgi:leader peptidase (prepilin peptidase)/N-methyltransferase